MTVDFHRHCQATVLGATGLSPGTGLTWEEIDKLDLQYIQKINSNWRLNFLDNENMTQDLAGILKLIDLVAGRSGGGGGPAISWNLEFLTNNKVPIDQQTLDPDNPPAKVQFNNFGRDVKIKIGNDYVWFNTMKENTYYDENGIMQNDRLEVEIPDNKPTSGDLITVIGSQVSVKCDSSISPSKEYSGLIGIAGEKNNRQLTAREPYLTQTIFDQLYPIGSVYITMNPEKPFQNLTGIESEWEPISQGMCLWGSNESHPKSGENISAGLPNITGKIGNPTKTADGEVLTGLDHDSPGNNPDGTAHTKSAIYLGDRVTDRGGMATTVGARASGYLTMTLDANRNNPIYGNSNTVQPPAFVVHIWKRVETTA